MEKKKVKVVIAEENALLRSAMENCFYKDEQIDVCGFALNGEQALEMVAKFQPDVLVTDVILPKLDGIAVLDKLPEVDPHRKCKVIVLSALTQESFVVRAINAGARYYMAKPFEMNVLKARIIECGLDAPVIPRISGESALISSGNGVPKSRDEKISTIFITIGIPAHIKGYQFLREAIKMVIDEPDIINRITKELYPGIAKRFGTTPSKVERAIRHAIEVAWTRGKIDNINQIFGFNVYGRNDKPTNGEFIALVADKLLLEKSA